MILLNNDTTAYHNNRMTSNQTIQHNYNSKSTNNLLPQLRRNESFNAIDQANGKPGGAAGPSIET